MSPLRAPSLCGLTACAIFASAAIISTLVDAYGSEHHILVKGDTSAALEAALAEARQHRSLKPDDAVVVDLPTRLALDHTIQLSHADSGAHSAPLTFRGSSGGGTTISGALDLSEVVPLDADAAAVISRMPKEVRSRVRAYALGGAAVRPAFAPYSSFSPSQPGRLFVFERNQRLRPARWPVQGFFDKPVIVPSDRPTALTLRLPDAAAKLEAEHDAWVAGYWGWNWWYDFTKVESVSDGQIVMSAPKAPVRASARFAFVNVAAGLDRPGKVYEDAGRVYLIPEEPQGEVVSVPVVNTLLHLDKADNVRFENVAFEKSVGAAVSIEQSSGVVLSDCRISHTGTFGLAISGGIGDRVERCVVEDTGFAAVAVGGGDPETLTPAEHVIENCRISHFGAVLPSYQPGIRIGGVGVTVKDNEIYDAPHAGVIFAGNDHHIVGNIFHHLLLDSDDSGAVYTGRNWSARGTVVESNFFHDISNHLNSSLVVGVYLDDEQSGATVAGNVFINVDRAILVGGGRDNIVRGNLALHSRSPEIKLDSRGTSWQADMVKPGGPLWKSVQMSPERSALYAKHYPGFETTLTDRPGAPVGNRFEGNLADQTPLVDYEKPELAHLGAETGSRIVAADADSFPQAGNPLLPGDPDREGIEKTRKIILATMDRLRSIAAPQPNYK